MKKCATLVATLENLGNIFLKHEGLVLVYIRRNHVVIFTE